MDVELTARRVKRVVSLGTLVIGIMIVFPASAGGATAGTSSNCPDQPAAPADSTVAATQTELTGPAGDQVLDLGHDSGFNDLEIPMTVTSGTLPSGLLDFEPGPFKSGKAHLPAGDMSVTVERRETKTVVLRLCIDPDKTGKSIPPGVYTGSVRVMDPRLSGSDIPIKVTVQLHQIVVLGWFGIPITAILGMLGVWITQQRARGKSMFHSEFGGWILTYGIWSVFVGGVASFGVYRSALANPGFGDLGVDVPLLLGGMVAAAYGVASVTSAVKSRDAASPANGNAN